MPRRKKSADALMLAVMLVMLVAFVMLMLIGRQAADPSGHVVGPPGTVPATMRIASWNLQRFGTDKARDPALMAYYADMIRPYDIVVLQEITDSSGDAFRRLCGMLPEYTCSASARLGNTSYKEQYGLLYRNADLEAVAPGAGSYVRPPYTYMFSAGRWSFYLTTIHADPDNVKPELSRMEKDLGSFGSEDHIIIGDLNADCSYYKTPPSEYGGWIWAVPDSEDTTVRDSDCAYDRIILNAGASDNYVSYGVMRNVSAGQSDHYLVYAEFLTDVS